MREAKAQHAGLPFMLAILLQDTELIERTARRAVRLSDYDISSTLLDEEWKRRLVSLPDKFVSVDR